MSDNLKQQSKFLSLVLRHEPESIGLTLDSGGWALLSEVIRCANAHGQQLTQERIETIVLTNDKQRFALSDDGTKIRANQGHSVTVDLGLQPVCPPPRLFHGTASRFLEAILQEGLKPGSRQSVHLSSDEQTAVAVGKRHGRPVVLDIDALAMHAEGHAFYQADNGVWLVSAVPPKYITRNAQGD